MLCLKDWPAIAWNICWFCLKTVWFQFWSATIPCTVGPNASEASTWIFWGGQVANFLGQICPGFFDIFCDQNTKQTHILFSMFSQPPNPKSICKLTGLIFDITLKPQYPNWLYPPKSLAYPAQPLSAYPRPQEIRQIYRTFCRFAVVDSKDVKKALSGLKRSDEGWRWLEKVGSKKDCVADAARKQWWLVDLLCSSVLPNVFFVFMQVGCLPGRWYLMITVTRPESK